MPVSALMSISNGDYIPGQDCAIVEVEVEVEFEVQVQVEVRVNASFRFRPPPPPGAERAEQPWMPGVANLIFCFVEGGAVFLSECAMAWALLDLGRLQSRQRVFFFFFRRKPACWPPGPQTPLLQNHKIAAARCCVPWALGKNKKVNVI